MGTQRAAERSIRVVKVVAALAAVRPGARTVSICTGAVVPAAAGLLDDRRATTHWALAELFRSWLPRVRLDPNVLSSTTGTS
ncbi:transcriptional activator FtrA [Streptomyces sp. ADI98-10]|nr:transcriptional activator FtrA [Streptomyces sp. ADI98-10]